MQHSTGIARNLMGFSSLEDTILPDNPVLLVDAFINSNSFATVFGTTGKNPRGKGKMGFDWVVIKTIPKLGFVVEKAAGRWRRVLF